MDQVFEIARFNHAAPPQPIEYIRKIVEFSRVALCAAMLVACGTHPKNDSQPLMQNQGKDAMRTLKRGLPGEPRTLDPQLADDTYSFQVIRDIYEGLTAEGPTGSIVQGAADSWSVDATGTVYRFHLRPNATWSNGDRLLASEFVEGLQRAVDPHTASGSAEMLAIVKNATAITAGQAKLSALGASAIDEDTVEITLEHPAPFVLEILSQPIAAPRHRDRTHIDRTGSSTAANVLTNGPYVLTQRIPNSATTLKRNDKYWDAAHVEVSIVKYINAESETTELREYLADQLDLTFTIPMPDLKRVTEKFPDQVQSAPILATLYLALNLTMPPLEDNRDLRQALSMAIDREPIAEQVMMGVSPAYSFVPKGSTLYSSATYHWSGWSHERRMAYAKELYAKAGYSEKNPLQLKLYYNRDDGIQRVMVAIAGNLKKNLGVKCELIADEFRVFLEGRKDKTRWDAARLGWTADFDDPTSFLEVFTASSAQNDPGWHNREFDSLLIKADAESDKTIRNELLRHAEQIMLDDYPIIPVYFYKARRLVKPYVGGASITPMNRTYTKHLYWLN